MEKMLMMLVDDEERFLVTTSKLLARKGLDVVTAPSGAEALRKLAQLVIQVVVLDVKMPGMDGITTLKEIKNRFPHVEVILLTGHATVESAVEGLNAGACDYLMKPCNLDELIRKAHEAFERQRRLRETAGSGKTGSSGEPPG
jgi:DNA-binding NtrC family response regulator